MASISSLFGYILNFIYNLLHNYGLSIIIFSVLLKLILLPLSIKQQKTLKKTAKLQGKVKEIQEKYKNDQNKMNQEMMDLYKRENMSPLGGCLSSIIQIVILLAMFLLVRNPLTYMLKTDQNTVNEVTNYIKIEGENIEAAYPQISILKYVSKNRDKTIDLGINDFVEEYKKENDKNNNEDLDIEEVKRLYQEKKENEEISEKEENLVDLDSLYINMNFAGLDLSNIPKENWEDWTVFVIPVLYVVTSIVSMKLTTALTSSKKNKDIIEIKSDEKDKDGEKGNSPEDMSEQMNKSMTWFMPVMSVSISLIAPLGLALYWLVNNILMIIERVVLSKILKSEEEEEQNG